MKKLLKVGVSWVLYGTAEAVWWTGAKTISGFNAATDLLIKATSRSYSKIGKTALNMQDGHKWGPYN